MELFIRIKNDQPFEHPILGDNFRQAFPDIDVDNLPPEFAPFVRVDAPVLGVYQVYDGVTYQKVGDVYTDVHQIRAMTAEEVTAKQQLVKDLWAQDGLESWIFNEITCAFEPPTP